MRLDNSDSNRLEFVVQTGWRCRSPHSCDRSRWRSASRGSVVRCHCFRVPMPGRGGPFGRVQTREVVLQQLMDKNVAAAHTAQEESLGSMVKEADRIQRQCGRVPEHDAKRTMREAGVAAERKP